MCRIIMWAVGLYLIAAMHASAVTAQPLAHERNGWVLGLNVGAGVSSQGTGFGETEFQGGGTGNFHFGYAVRPTTVIAFEGTAWTRNDGGATITLRYAGPSATFFPSNTGFFLRGGVGMGTRSVTKDGSSGSAEGFALLLGAGNEFRIRQTFAIAPQLEYVWMRVGSQSSPSFLSLTGAFIWYWGNASS